jgi:aminoglycoside phosphotransferase
VAINADAIVGAYEFSATSDPSRVAAGSALRDLVQERQLPPNIACFRLSCPSVLAYAGKAAAIWAWLLPRRLGNNTTIATTTRSQRRRIRAIAASYQDRIESVFFRFQLSCSALLFVNALRPLR